ncbi:hypothetical protein Pori4_00153 [Pseudomonas phage vB_PpuM-Pori-4]
MTKHVDMESIGNIRTLPEALGVVEGLLKYPITKDVINPLLQAYVEEPGHNTQVIDSTLDEGSTHNTDAAFIQLASMTSAFTLLTQLRNHVRKHLPENSVYTGLDNEKVVETIEKGLRATRKHIIDTIADCYTNLLNEENAELARLNEEVLGYLNQHFTSISVDGSVDHLLNNRNHTRFTMFYQINFPEEASGTHTFNQVVLVLTYVPEMGHAWLNLLPAYTHAGAFHPGDRINLNSIGASVVHQLSRYDLV